MAMRSLPSIALDEVGGPSSKLRAIHRADIVIVNGANKAKQREQQLAHIARCEARARANGQPRYV